MKLKEILKNVQYELNQGNLEISIDHITFNSAEIKQNSLFIAISGNSFDGHNFIEDVSKSGTTAVIVEKEIKKRPKDLTVIKVDSTRKILAHLSANFYDHPSKYFDLIGVTGTNGKTSVSYLLSQVLCTPKNVGYIGTLGQFFNSKPLSFNNCRTTPESIHLQELFSKLKDKKTDSVIMEVSSIAVEEQRIDHCDFDIGIFTNLTLDHLDYHITVENYENAKMNFFDLCKKIVTNNDDSVGQKIAQKTTKEKEIITYGIEKESDIMATDIVITNTGSEFNIKYQKNVIPISTQLTGKFNIYNILAVYGACVLLKQEQEFYKISKIEKIAGRCETVVSNDGKTVIIDYAHTDDALKNILETISEFTKGSIITVFGCGGNRDSSKRPLMGKVAGTYADYCIITTDNPRTEDPVTIIENIVTGIKETNCNYKVIQNRDSAIKYALNIAKKEDTVLIAGKGNENYQEIGTEKIPFCDKEVVLENL